MRCGTTPRYAGQARAERGAGGRCRVAKSNGAGHERLATRGWMVREHSAGYLRLQRGSSNVRSSAVHVWMHTVSRVPLPYREYMILLPRGVGQVLHLSSQA